MIEDQYTKLLVVLGVSLVTSILFHRFRLPSILAFIFAGAAIGPTGFGWVEPTATFSFLAEFGVVFLLFAIGLEFSFQRLRSIGSIVVWLGVGQVIVCTACFSLALYLWGLGLAAAFTLGGALAFSSTVIVVKLLGESRQLALRHGQLSIGVLLFQDFAALIFLIIVPVFAAGASESIAWSLAETAVRGTILFVLFIVVGHFLLPHIYKEVANRRSDELFMLSTLVIVLLSAWVTHLFELSMALGAFVIGMMLGGSPFQRQIESDIRPFRDLLLGLFLVSIGLQIDLTLFYEFWYRIIGAAISLLIFKFVLIALLTLALREDKRTATRTGIMLSQGGEFGIALISIGAFAGVVPIDVGSFLLLVIAVSMLISPLVMGATEDIVSRWLPEQVPEISPDRYDLPELHDHVIVGGYGRIGRLVCQSLADNGVEFVALDTNAQLVTREHTKGNTRIVFGDCQNIDLLVACGLSTARLLVLSMDDLSQSMSVIEDTRRRFPDIAIVVRAHNETSFEELAVAGANHVVPEMLETSLVVVAHTLRLLDLDEQQINVQIADLRAEARTGYTQ